MNIRIVISQADVDRAERDPFAPTGTALRDVASALTAGIDRAMKEAAAAALAPINASLADLADAVGATASADLDRLARVAGPDLRQVLHNIKGGSRVF